HQVYPGLPRRRHRRRTETDARRDRAAMHGLRPVRPRLSGGLHPDAAARCAARDIVRAARALTATGRSFLRFARRADALDVVALPAQLLDHAVLADQVQRTDDDQGIVGARLLEALGDLRHPGVVARDVDALVKLRELLPHLARHLVPHRRGVAVAPGRVQLLDRRGAFLARLQRLLQELELLDLVHAVEEGDLLEPGLETGGGLVRLLRLLGEVRVEAELRI